MDFTMGSIEEAKVAAQSADNVGGNFIKEPGAYAGNIVSATFKKFPSGAGGLEIEMNVKVENEQDKSLKFMIITLTKAGVSTYKDAKGNIHPLPGMNQISGGLLQITGKQKLSAVKNAKDEITYPVLEGCSIGVLIDIRKTGTEGGKVYENPQLVAFFDPKTNKTGSEILGNTEAKKKVKIEAGLKVIDDTVKSVSSDSLNDSDSDEGDDPFAIDDEGDTSDDSEVKDDFFDDVDETNDEGVDSE